MAYSNLTFVRYKGDGARTQFPLTVAGENMGYFRTEDIHTYIDGEEVANVIQPQSPHIVIISPAPAAGSDIMIRREMPVDKPYADFARGNNFGHRQVNNSFLQQLYLMQEVLDGFHRGGLIIDRDLDMNNHRIVNLKDADINDDKQAANVGTVKKLTNGTGLIHNNLAGRDARDAHPASSVTMKSGESVEDFANLAFVLSI